MTIPTLTYNSETWIEKKKQRRKVLLAEVKFLKNAAG
jgi:hypothetical protein